MDGRVVETRPNQGGRHGTATRPNGSRFAIGRVQPGDLRELTADSVEAAFYAGKRAAAIYYARNVAPGVMSKAAILATEEDSALTISDAGFATI